MGSNNIGNMPRHTPLTEMMPAQSAKTNGSNKATDMKIIYGDESKGQRLNSALKNLQNLYAEVQNHIGTIIPRNAE